jgi:hypothetical protein
MATPHATGVAALAASVAPGLLGDPVALKKLLMDSGKPDPATVGKTVSGKMVDAHAAAVAADTADNTAPTSTAALSQEPNQAGWHKQDVTVTLSATDNQGGSEVKELTYSATGAQPITSTTVLANELPKQLPIITTEGTTTISYFATDNASNQEAPAKTLTVKLDKTAPSFPVITSPTNNSFDRDGTITLSGTAEPNSTVEVFDGTTATLPTVNASASGAWTKTLSAVPNGRHAYQATATDAANNTSAFSNTSTVTVDTTKPSGTLLINNGATSTASRTVTLKVRATDPAPASGVAQMRFSNNGTTWSGWGAYATSKSWTLASGAGTKTVYVQYKDRAGNISAKARDSITYRP